MRALIIIIAALVSLCGSAYGQSDPIVQRPRPAAATAASPTSRPSNCLPIDVRPECHISPQSAATSLGPCLSVFNNINPDTFGTDIKACIDADIQAAIENAKGDPIDNVALDCLQPVQTIEKATSSGNVGVLLAFQLFRRAKQQGLIGKCTSYIQTTIMLQ